MCKVVRKVYNIRYLYGNVSLSVASEICFSDIMLCCIGWLYFIGKSNNGRHLPFFGGKPLGSRYEL